MGIRRLTMDGRTQDRRISPGESDSEVILRLAKP